jgi:hypothetical protein
MLGKLRGACATDAQLLLQNIQCLHMLGRPIGERGSQCVRLALTTSQRQKKQKKDE